MSNDTLLKKFNRLDPQLQDQLLAFWDSLLALSGTPGATMSEAYREQLMQVGTWTQEDVQALEDAAARWHWPVPEW